MSKYTISIPNSLYEKAQRLAKRTSQSVDDIICTWLEGALDQPTLDLPSDERAELQAMSYLSTDALWTIAREQMQPDLQHSMSQLMDKNSQGTITEKEFRSLSELVERGQRLTLRKSQAMKLLLERGYSVSLDALKPTDE
jgi:predicted CopG family antitoxin